MYCLFECCVDMVGEEIVKDMYEKEDGLFKRKKGNNVLWGMVWGV